MLIARVARAVWRFGRPLLVFILWVGGLAGATGWDWLRWLVMLLPRFQSPIIWVLAITIATVLATSIYYDIRDWRRRRRADAELRNDYNMTMRELFQHLRFCSRWAENQKAADECALAAGQEIEDRLRIGRVTCWGRDVSRVAATPEPIPSIFFTGTALDRESLCAKSQQLSAMTHKRDCLGQERQFKDLRVNRAQVLDMWPMSDRLGRLSLRRNMWIPMLDGEPPRRWSAVRSVFAGITTQCAPNE
jgi:hypothetical protein